jgi:alpha-beta hydrolase superfamily lysophospholipase
MSPVLTQLAVPVTSIHKVEADGVNVFYRAAGDPGAPVVLLLHGFPTSSFMFRELIPRLADRFRVIAPDLPGFGFTEVPEKRKYTYSFDALARTIEAFTNALGLNEYQRSFRRTAMPTKRGSATRGDPFGNIGRSRQQKTAK